MTRSVFFIVIFFTFFFLQGCSGNKNQIQISESALTLERFGEVKILKPPLINRVVLLFASTKNISQPEFINSIRPLIDAGAVIFIIDSDKYILELKKDGGDCLSIGGEIERVGQSLQNSIKLQQYFRPILVGLGSGALITYATRFQNPARFASTLAYDLCPKESENLKFCATDSLRRMENENQSLLIPKPPDQLESALKISFQITWSKEKNCTIPEGSNLFPGTVKDRSFADLLNNIIVDTSETDSSFQNPVIELPAEQPRLAAIFLSGDGGWAGIDQDTGEDLKDNHIGVIGFSSLKYFWRKKTPEETSTTIEQLIEKYRKKWFVSRFILVGYSLGADAIPLVYNRLNSVNKSAIEKIILISPEKRADLEVHITDWLGLDDPDIGVPLKEEIEKIPSNKILCISGIEDDDGLCDALERKTYKVVELPGGHHYNGDYDAITKVILQTLSTNNQ